MVRESCNSEIQYPVVDYINLRNPVTYKNTGCAMCNGLPPRSHRCMMIFPQNMLRNLPGSNSNGVVEHVDFCGKLFMSKSDDLESTDELHHVITNYNSDMTRTVVVNEDDRYIVPIVHECPYGAVFDPFWGECRQIHCQQGYVLEDNQCVLSMDVKAIINEFTEFVSDVISSKNATPNIKLIITVNVSMDGKPIFEFFKNHSVLHRIIQFFNSSEFDFWSRFENSTYAFFPVRPRWMNNTEVDATYNASGNAIHGIKSSKFNSATKYNSANAKKDIAVYIKLLTTTGFGWVLGYVAALSTCGALWTFFLVLVGLQGVFIFLAFFCNKRVLMLYVSLVKGTRKGRHTRASSSTGVDSPRSSINKLPASVSEEVRFKTFGKSKFGLEVNSILERKESHVGENRGIGSDQDFDYITGEGIIYESEEEKIEKESMKGEYENFEEVFL
ncbi:hypothetical protein HOLleu_38759 [Holothuria leucospilota]|uniref:Uncharacterized protein n=1 Tax=Holothuria leucospilota TaxID=206669 RepID=A0A9Q0YHE7_HOLLE|nr:hypothetical protein HOLleu_38759 [Holothuria leucospilota]